MAINEFKQERIDFAKFHKTAEKQLLPLFRKALKQTISRVIQYARDYGLDTLTPELLIDPNVWKDVYPKAYEMIGVKMARREYYRQKRLEGMATKESSISFLVDIWTKILRDYSLTYVYNIARELNDTTIEIIKRALGDAYSLGIGSDGAIRLFEQALNGSMKTRSYTISRTEATTISNLGKDIAARSWIDEQGGEGYKVWLGRNDVKERPSHIAENDTIIGIDELYELGGTSQCERPGDIQLPAKERINCRCTQSLMSQNRYNAYVKRGRIVNGKLIGAS